MPVRVQVDGHRPPSPRSEEQKTTAAAIDRLVHHATIIEIDRDSIRAEEAKRRAEEARRRKDPKRTTTTAATDDNYPATTIQAGDDNYPAETQPA